MSFSVTDDTVALETTEAYILVLEVVGDEDVVIGDSRQGIFPSVSIQITDDDSEYFESGLQLLCDNLLKVNVFKLNMCCNEKSNIIFPGSFGAVM